MHVREGRRRRKGRGIPPVISGGGGRRWTRGVHLRVCSSARVGCVCIVTSLGTEESSRRRIGEGVKVA